MISRSSVGCNNWGMYLPSATVVAERLCFHKHLSFCPWWGMHGMGACMVGAMLGRRACVAGENAWQGDMHGRGHAW